MDSGTQPLPFQETVEAHGHLIDSHIMERIFEGGFNHELAEYGWPLNARRFRLAVR